MDRGTYTKWTGTSRVYEPDAAAHTTDEHGAPRPPRANHTGAFETVAGHTLLSSPNPWLVGEEAECAWYAPGHDQHDPDLYDPEYLRQQRAGHKKSEDCMVRLAATAHMAQVGLERPTAVHW